MNCRCIKYLIYYKEYIGSITTLMLCYVESFKSFWCQFSIFLMVHGIFSCINLYRIIEDVNKWVRGLYLQMIPWKLSHQKLVWFYSMILNVMLILQHRIAVWKTHYSYAIIEVKMMYYMYFRLSSEYIWGEVSWVSL